MSKPNFSLEGKVAIITGARRGFGKEIALTFAEAGADVGVCDVVVEGGELEAVAKEIQGFGRRSLAIQVDIRRKADVENMVQSVVNEFGRVDILVNNAGVNVKCLLLEFSEDDYDKVIDTDLKGYFLCSQAAGRRMAKQKGGSIINIAAGAATRPPLKSGPYSAAKAGVFALTKSLALELATDNIRANAISPGYAKTGITEWLWRDHPEALQEKAEKIPLGRIAETSDIAAAALFLASDASRYITGATILVDGGSSLI
jgi:NAD(P)-dependent dehydrogenase (short-subunit alcohol dehydrogenase family)